MMSQHLANEISVRNVYCDYYLERTNAFNRTSLPNARAPIPVLRVFGILESGEKCCVHLHGAFPYFLLRIDRDLSNDLRSSLIQALNAVFNANQKRRNDLQHAIYDIVEIPRSESMYGYHRTEERFVKVFLYNPQTAHFLIESLHRESVRNARLQPFQAHIPFVLQFFIDYAIFGMDLLRLKNCKFRVGKEAMKNCDAKYFGLLKIADVVKSDRLSPLDPASTVSVEFDAFVDDITNREHLIDNQRSSNPGLEFIWRDEERRSAQRGEKVPSELSQEDTKPHFVSESEVKDLSEIRRLLDMGTPKISPISPDGVNLDETISAMSQALNETIDDLLNQTEVLTADQSHAEINLDYEREDSEAEMEDEEDHNQLANPPSNEPDHDEDSNMPYLDNMGSTGPTDFSDFDLPRPKSNVSFYDIFDEKMARENEDGGRIRNEDREREEKDEDEVDWNAFFDLEPPDHQSRSLKHAFVGWITPVSNLRLKKRMKSTGATQSSKISKLSEKSVISEAEMESWCLEKTYGNFDSRVMTTSALTKSPMKGPLPKLSGEVSDIRNLCTLSIELLVPCQPSLPIADPQIDAVYGVFYALHRDVCVQDESPDVKGGWTTLSDDLLVWSNRKVERVDSEVDIFNKLVDLIRSRNIDRLRQRAELVGYLLERDAVVGSNFARAISRCSESLLRISPIPGRIVLNLWKICRSDLTLRVYSFANIVLNVLDRRVPEFTPNKITQFVRSGEPRVIATLIDYLLTVAAAQTQILCQMDFFTKTAEMARVYGIQFFEVLSRGSQFRVESMLLRLAASLGFIGASVSPAQRSKMDAAEIIPLNLEPQSGIYRDPILVLDFQSLYPSIAIAYNYCFTTCLGKIGKSHDVTMRMGD